MILCVNALMDVGLFMSRDEGRVTSAVLTGEGGGGRVGRLVGCSGVRMLACVVRVSFASVGYIYIYYIFIFCVYVGVGGL